MRNNASTAYGKMALPLVLAAMAVALCAALIACAVWFTQPAEAAGRTGSITIEAVAELDGKNVRLAGDTYSLAQVATAEVSSGSVESYSTVETFSSFSYDWASLDASGLRAAAQEMGVYATENNLLTAGSAVADSSGTASFWSLDAGLYLVVRTSVAEGNEAVVCDPVLVSVPTSEAGVTTWNVVADLKFEWASTPDSNGGEEGNDTDKFIEFLNEQGLPVTGDTLPVFAAVVLAACAAFIVLLAAFARSRSEQLAEESE